MGIVIDTNALCPVFDRENRGHSEFAPVLRWILDGRGRMVYGGSKYKRELTRLRKVRRMVVELGRAGRVDVIDGGAVDKKAEEVKSKVRRRTFNDHHIVAIVIVGRCRFICSGDKRAHAFFKKKGLYPKGTVPRIYSGRRNAGILRK